MQALILVGGLGTRMRSVVADRPLALLSVAGEPVLAQCLRRLVAQGVQDIVLATGHLGLPIRAYFGDGKAYGCQIRYSQEAARLGTAGALRLAEPLLAERFLVLHGNAVVDFNVQDLLTQHQQARADATLLVAQPAADETPDLKLDSQGLIVEVDRREPGVTHRWAGVGLMERRVVRLVPLGVSDLEKSVFPALARRRMLRSVALTGGYYSVAAPRAYARTLAAFAPRQAATSATGGGQDPASGSAPPNQARPQGAPPQDPQP
jgi:NDP-sugar pyrophosphorylase family protein